MKSSVREMLIFGMNDFIQKVNQTTIQNQNEFYLAMKSAKLNGESIVLQILRDGKNMDVRIGK
jgi:S1-C subfamily serine protease